MGQEHLGSTRRPGYKPPRGRGALSRCACHDDSTAVRVLTDIGECEIHNRAKDVGTATADWFSELLSPNPWFKDVVPNVRRWRMPQAICD